MYSYELIPHAPYGQQPLCVFWVVAKLLTQSVYMHMEGLELGIAVASPHRTEKVFLFSALP